MNLLGVVIVTIVTFFLCGFVYKCDRKDKEPKSLLWKLFLFSIGSIVIAVFLEQRLGDLLFLIFKSGFVLEDGEYYFRNGLSRLIYNICANYFVIACSEEAAKFIVIYLLTRKNKNFNCTYDGIIYSIICALGFSLFEDILYIINLGGFETAVLRAKTEMAGHMFFAAIFGYFYGRSKVYFDAERLYKKAVDVGFNLKSMSYDLIGKRLIVKGLILSVLVHGTYDLICRYPELFNIIFPIYAVLSTLLCIYLIIKASRMDEFTVEEAENIIINDNYCGADAVMYLKENGMEE